MSQIKIVFTKLASPISDFNAELEVNGILTLLDYHVESSYKQTKKVKVCNVLVYTMLRAAYYSFH
jgi:hypothetical protein